MNHEEIESAISSDPSRLQSLAASNQDHLAFCEREAIQLAVSCEAWLRRFDTVPQETIELALIVRKLAQLSRGRHLSEES